MRNLREHPITKSEVIAVLGDLAQRVGDDDRVGSISGIIVRHLLSEVEKPHTYNILFARSDYFEIDTMRTPVKDI